MILALLGFIGTAIIIVVAIATPTANTRQDREIWFYVISAAVVLKIAVVEIARFAC